ncbi:MAG: TRAP transporter large permease [Desulfobacteraceae bacterium]|nr:MAG: TRAP transporter large permease [Desulfobacteraceae bacterium]
MTDIVVALLSIAGILLLISAGLPVAFSLSVLSFLGVWHIKGSFDIASTMMAQAAADSVNGYIYGVIPLFVLMGMLVSISGMGKDTFDVANRVFRRIRGGLGIATVVANAVFAAVTGVSIASAAVFSKVAVPEMIRLGHKPRFAVGVVSGSSVLGMLIPPSLLLILFGVLTETSIGDLFIGGIGPGILLSAIYCTGILVMAYRFPHYVGNSGGTNATASCPELSMGRALWKAAPILALIGLVLGGIYSGWFTPTESGAAGALGAMLIALCKRQLSPSKLWQVLMETGNVTVAILFLFFAASMYGRMLALSGLTGFVGEVIGNSGLGVYSVLTMYLFIILLMGMILDSASIMMIIVPLLYPVMKNFGVDFVWWGILTLITIEVGLLTPPLGMAVFVVQSSLDDQSINVTDIFAGSLPFVLMMMVLIALLVFFPSISLFLVY